MDDRRGALPDAALALMAVLERMSAHDDREECDIRETHDWIASGSPLYRQGGPAMPSKHLVSYCAVVTEDIDQIFMLEHIKSGLWLPPGGHVDVDEDPFLAARRELLEETGEDLRSLFDVPVLCTVTETIGSLVPTHTDVSLWYAFKADAGCVFKLDSEECTKGRWFSLAELPLLATTPDLARFIEKARRNIS